MFITVLGYTIVAISFVGVVILLHYALGGEGR